MSTKQAKETKKDSSKEKKQQSTKKNDNSKNNKFRTKIKKNTKITDLLTYNVKNVMFEEVVEQEVPNQKVPVKVYRINIYTKNPDGSFGDLICEFGELMCFGVSVNTNPQTGEPNGYSMSLSLMSKENPTEEEKLRIAKLEEIVERAKEYLVEHRNEVKERDLEMRDLNKKPFFTPIYYKKDADGNRIDGPPSMYPKLLEKKPRKVKEKNEDGVEEEKEIPGKILTVFYEVDDNGEPKLKLDKNGEPELDEHGNTVPLELDTARIIDKYCKVRPLIKIESIFVGTSKKLQVKVSEADVKLLQSSSRRLLHTSNKTDNKENKNKSVEKLMKNDDNNENETTEKNDKNDKEKVEKEK